MHRTTGQLGFYGALTLLVAFSIWSVHLVGSVSRLRDSVETRVRWLVGIERLQQRADTLQSTSPTAELEPLADDVVRFAAHGLDVLSRMSDEWRAERQGDETISHLITELRLVRAHALRRHPSAEDLLRAPGSVSTSLHDLVTVVRADNARISQQLGEQVALLHYLVFGALALAGLACALLGLVRQRTRRLEDSEQRFALVSAGARDAIWDWDVTAGTVHYSERWTELLGVPETDLRHLEDWTDRIHPDDLTSFRVALDAHLASRVAWFESEHRVRVASGDQPWLWVLARGLVVRDSGGRAIRVAGSLTDVTDRRRAAARREKAELLEQATRAVGIGVALHHPDETLRGISPALGEMVSAWPSPDAWWSEVQRFGWIPAAEPCPHCSEAAFRGSMQTAVPAPSGQRRVFEITWAGHAHNLATRPGAHVLLVQDIGDKVAAGQQLAQGHDRFALAARATNDALWEWAIDANRLSLSPRWRQMLGLDEERVPNTETPGAWLSRVHPDDLRGLQDAIGAHLDGHTNRLEYLHRVRGADDAYRWITVHGIAVRDGAGTVHRIVGSFRDVTDFRATEAELRRSAESDGLTGLPNRGAFCAAVTEALEDARATADFGFAVAGIDLDGLGLVNDTLGTIHGDRVLRAAARRLRGVVREGELLARIGGDEFGLLLRGVHSDGDLHAALDRIQEPLSVALDLDGHDVFPTAGVGVARGHDSYCFGQDLLRDAETAMRRAATRGVASRDVFRPPVRTHARKTLRLNADLRRALDRRELCLFYQPLVPLNADHAVGFEALLRWRHNDFGLVSPGAFIPLAEDTGLIVPIGLWVLQDACRQIVEWNRTFSAPVHVSVNLSTRQLQEDDLVPRIASIIEQTGVDPAMLHLEITESVIMENPDEAVARLRALKSLGVLLSIDDFGTGYSSLSYLQRFPIDILKIDRSFISPTEGADGSGDCNQIVASIVELSHNLELTVIAEGVETEQQLSTLRGLACDIAQGYLFSRPVPVAEATALLEQWDDRFSPLLGPQTRPRLRVVS